MTYWSSSREALLRLGDSERRKKRKVMFVEDVKVKQIREVRSTLNREKTV
jgi:hypothetical protein